MKLSFSPTYNTFLSLILSFFIAAWATGQDLEEVIVEAERRDMSTLDITESIDAFDLEDLETQQIKGFADISNNLPGLTASPSGSQGLRFTLRGVGARDSQLGVESKVGLYVDGAFLGRASGLVFDIVDLERVEVLKGPQGFTFGRSAIGGAINLITAKANPDERYARIELKSGNFDRNNVTVLGNLPINDNFAMRAAVFNNVQEGWVENTGLGVDFGGYDRKGARVSFRWIPRDDMTLDYSYDVAEFTTQPVFYQPLLKEGSYEFDRNDYRNGNAISNIAIQQTDINDPSQQVFGLNPGRKRLDTVEAYPREIENSTTEADGHTLAFRWDWSDSHALDVIGTHRSSDVINTFYFYPNIVSDENFSSAYQKGNGLGNIVKALEGLQFGSSFFSIPYTGAPFQSFQELTFENLARLDGSPEAIEYADAVAKTLAFSASQTIALPGETQPANNYLCVDCRVGDPPNPYFDFYTLFSAISDNFNTSPSGLAGPYALRNRINTMFSSPPGGLYSLRDHKQFSLEVRQSGFFLDDRIAYTGGLYYFNERTGNGQQLPKGVLYTDLVELLDFGRSTGGTDIPENQRIGFSIVSINELDLDHYGAYFNIDYTPLILDERLTTSFGLRWSKDQRALYRQSLQAITLNLRGDPDIESASWYSIDPRLKLSYAISDDLVGYFSLTHGYRPGSFNVEARSIISKYDTADSLGSDLRFEEESQIAYEFGLKGTVLDGLADLEFAVFYYDIKDGQETVVYPKSPISRSIVNADGYSYGIEIDASWYLTDNLTLTTNYAFLRSGSDTYVTPFIYNAGRKLDIKQTSQIVEGGFSDAEIFQNLIEECVGALRRVDVENGRCVERKNNFGSPVNSWQVALDYRLPTNYGEFFVHLGYNYKDAYYVNDALKVDSRNLWDLRVQTQFDTDQGVVRVALWSQNMFDNEYQTQKFELNSYSYDIASYGMPRTYGIDVIFEFLD